MALSREKPSSDTHIADRNNHRVIIQSHFPSIHSIDLFVGNRTNRETIGLNAQARIQEGHCSSLSESGISVDRRRAAALFGKSKQSPKEPISCRGSRIENRSTAELEQRIDDRSGEVAFVDQPLIRRLAGRPLFPHNSRRSHQDGLANWCRPTGFDRFGGTHRERVTCNDYIYIYWTQVCPIYEEFSK